MKTLKKSFVLVLFLTLIVAIGFENAFLRKTDAQADKIIEKLDKITDKLRTLPAKGANDSKNHHYVLRNEDPYVTSPTYSLPSWYHIWLDTCGEIWAE